MKQLTDSEKILLGLIASFGSDGCYMTNSAICERLYWDERKTIRVVRSLKEKGLIDYFCDGYHRNMTIKKGDKNDTLKGDKFVRGGVTKVVEKGDKSCKKEYQKCHPENKGEYNTLCAPPKNEFLPGIDPTPKKRTPKTLPIPSIDDVIEYINHHPEYNDVDPESFWNYYEARGWKYGRGVDMKNWKAAVRTWHFKNLKRATHV